MSRAIAFDHFMPVESKKFLAALTGAGLDAGRFVVSKMEISPPLMPGHITALVTVKLASGGIAFSYEDSSGSSWVEAFEDDLRAGRFLGQGKSSRAVPDAADSEPTQPATS